MPITVFIRYQIDPFKAAAFEAYARRWLTIIPRCGGDLVGYWAPHEGANNVAFGLISFASLSAYEKYDQAFLEKAAEVLRCDPASLIMRAPSEPEGIWMIWEQVPVQERGGTNQLLRVISGKRVEGGV